MKLVCVGRNYAAHIAELSNARPDAPVLFIKPDSAILPNQQDFYIPEFSKDVHYEVELLVRICKVGKHISPQFAPTYYHAFTVGIDFTARDLQQQLKDLGLPWEKAKSFDGSTSLESIRLPLTVFAAASRRVWQFFRWAHPRSARGGVGTEESVTLPHRPPHPV